MGLCYTISPAYVQALAMPLGLVTRRIEKPVLLREMSLFRPADRSLSPAASGFVTHVEARLKDKPTGDTHSRPRPRGTQQ